MNDLIKRIEQANEIQPNDIIRAVMRRYNQLNTEREASFLSLPTDLKTRNEHLDEIFRYIRSCYNKQDAQN